MLCGQSDDIKNSDCSRVRNLKSILKHIIDTAFKSFFLYWPSSSFLSVS